MPPSPLVVLALVALALALFAIPPTAFAGGADGGTRFAPAGRDAATGWTLVRETRSGVVYPRSGLPAVDAALRARQLASASEALACRARIRALGLRENEEDGWARTVTVTYRSPRLVAFKESGWSSCGASHPTERVDGLILDARTGRRLSVADLWPKLTPNELHRRFVAAYRAADPEPDCEGELPPAGDAPPYAAVLTRTGLTLWPEYFSVVARVCAREIALPLPLPAR